MRRQRTQLSLRVTHPERDLSSVCRTLELRPKIIWKKGDERRTPKGTSVGGVRESSYCWIDFGAASKASLSKKIEAAAKLLKPHRATLRRISSTGGRISFAIGRFCDEDTGEDFSCEMLAVVAGLRIGLDLYIYVPEEHTLGPRPDGRTPQTTS